MAYWVFNNTEVLSLFGTSGLSVTTSLGPCAILECWIQANSGGPVFTVLDNTQANLFSVAANQAGVIALTVAGTTDTTGQPTSASDGCWHHLALAVGDQTYVLLDGELILTGNAVPNLATATTLILGLASLSNMQGGFQGALSNFRVWNLPALMDFGDFAAQRFVLTPTCEQQPLGIWSFADSNFNNLASGSPLTATPLGSPQFLEGGPTPQAFSYALSLGLSDMALTPVTEAFAFGQGDFSIAVWVQPKAPGTVAAYGTSGNLGATGGWFLTISEQGSVSFRINGSPPYDSPANTLRPGEWNRVLVVRQSGSLQIYVNALPALAPLTASSQAIGVDESPVMVFGPGAPFTQSSVLDKKGGGDVIPGDIGDQKLLISDVALWSLARDPQQDILSAYSQQPAGVAGLTGYWPLSLGCVMDASGANLGMAQFLGSPRLTRGAGPASPPIFAYNQSPGQPGISLPAQLGYATGSSSFSLTTVISTQTAANMAFFSTFSGTGTGFTAGVTISEDGGNGRWSMVFMPPTGGPFFAWQQLPISVTDGAWHHFAYVVDTQTRWITFYVDGMDCGSSWISQDYIDFPNNFGASIGGAQSGYSPFVGQMASLEFWPVALAQTDIQALICGGAAPAVAPLGDWSFYPQGAVDLSPAANSSLGPVEGIEDLVQAPFVAPPTYVLSLNQAAVQTSTNDSPPSPGPFTVLAWCRPQVAGQTGDVISLFDGALSVALNGGQLSVSYGGSSPLSGRTVLQAGQWYHIGLVFSTNGEPITLYVNGITDAGTPDGLTNADPSASPAVLLGSSTVVADFGFFAVIPAQYTDAQVAQSIYSLAGGATSLVEGAAPWIWWNFTSGNLNNLNDSPYSLTLEATPPAVATLALSSPPPMQDNTGFLQEDGIQSALWFPWGSQNNALVVSAPSLQFAGSFTIEAYFRLDQSPKGVSTPFVLAGSGAQSAYGYQLNVYGDSNGNWQCAFQTQNLNNDYSPDVVAPAGPNGLEVGVWYYVCGVFDQTAMTKTVYLWQVQPHPHADQLAATSALPVVGVIPYYGEPTFGIGGLPYFGPSNTFCGWLCEIRAWSVARKPEDIRSGLGRSVAPAQPDLAAYWPGTSLLPLEDQSLVLPDVAHGLQAVPTTAGMVLVARGGLSLKEPRPTITIDSALIQDWDEEDAKNNNLDGTARYRSVITVTGADGMPVKGCKVRLWAVDGPTDDFGGLTLRADGKSYAVSPNEAAEFATNSFGVVSIVMKPKGLGAPALQVWAEFMPKDERIVVMPDENVLDRMKTITGPDLTQGTTPLLDPGLFNPDEAQGLASAMNGMAGAVTRSGAQRSFKYRRVRTSDSNDNDQVRDFVYVVEDDQVFSTGVAAADLAEQFRVTYSSTQVVVVPLSSSISADDSRPAYYIRGSQRSDPGSVDGWALWDDFVNGVQQITSMVVEVVANEVKAVVEWADKTIHCVIDTVTSLGEALVGMFAQAIKVLGQTASEFFGAVVNFFRRAFDMDAIAELKSRMETEIILGFRQIGPIVQQSLIDIKQEMSTWPAEVNAFAETLSSEYGSLSLGSLASGQSPLGAMAGESQMVLSGSVEFGMVSSWLESLARQGNSVLSIESITNSSWYPALVELGNQFESISSQAVEAIETLINDLPSLFSDPRHASQWLIQAAIDLVSSIVNLAISMLTAIVSVIASMPLEEMFTALLNQLTSPIEIPVLSWLVEEVTGQQLTLLSTITFPACLLANALVALTGSSNGPSGDLTATDVMALAFASVTAIFHVLIVGIKWTAVNVPLAGEVSAAYDYQGLISLAWLVVDGGPSMIAARSTRNPVLRDIFSLSFSADCLLTLVGFYSRWAEIPALKGLTVGLEILTAAKGLLFAILRLGRNDDKEKSDLVRYLTCEEYNVIEIAEIPIELAGVICKSPKVLGVSMVSLFFCDELKISLFKWSSSYAPSA